MSHRSEDGRTGGGALTPSETTRSGDGAPRRVLVCVDDDRQLPDLLGQLAVVPGCRVYSDGSAPLVAWDDVVLQLDVAHGRDDTLARLRHGYYHFVIIDLRDLDGEDRDLGHAFRCAASLVDGLDGQGDIEAGYGFHRIVALVAARDDDLADRLIADLARRGVGRVLRDRSARPAGAGAVDPHGVAFARLLLQDIVGRMRARRVGRRALCCAGGGITGIYFEMGVLKCLDDCLLPGGTSRFDDYYGISAGAIVNGVLANGYSVDEMMAGILATGEGRLGALDFGLLRWENLNVRAYGRRLADAGRDLAVQVGRAMRGRASLSPESLLLRYSDLLIAPLHGNAFEGVLRRIFAHPGATDDFRQLSRRLFIGATNQDTRTHVVFGSAGHDHVPISKAIHASFALNPAFLSTQIDGAWYEDGAVTRTSNFGEAIGNGADLLFIVDPFVPYVSKEPGYAHGRGFLYNIDQDIRTLSYTRFERARIDELRKHPGVSSYTFLPANRLRRLMSANPMDHRPYLPIWRGAYLSTLRRVHLMAHRMAGDLRAHGMRLDTSRADAVAARLERTRQPQFGDFFPDGKVELRLSPLALEAKALGGRSERAMPAPSIVSSSEPASAALAEGEGPSVTAAAGRN